MRGAGALFWFALLKKLSSMLLMLIEGLSCAIGDVPAEASPI